MKRILLILVLETVFGWCSYGQETINFKSEILNEERAILIGLPSGYELNQNQRYPLLLVTDGDSHFNLVYEATKLLYQDGYPRMVVAAITNTDRSRDLTFSKSEEAPSGGGAGNFLSFIQNELLPKLENQYRISKYKGLLGHSAGGLFSMFALVQSPELFQAHIAVTPTMRWDNFSLIDSFNPLFVNKLNTTLKKIHLSIGNETGLEREGVIRLKSHLENIDSTGFRFLEYPKDSHVLVPWKAYLDGLKFIFSSFQPPAELHSKPFQETIKYYEEIGKTYDYDGRVPQRILLNRGYTFMTNLNKEATIEVFEYYATSYPNIPIPFRILGDIFLEMNDYDLARKNYKKAYSMNPTKYVKMKLKELGDP